MADFFQVDTNITYTYEDVADLGTGKFSANTASPFDFTIGTGNGAVDTIFRDKLELRTGNSWTIEYDLSALTDAYGVVKNFSKVKVLYIKNTSDDVSETAVIAVLEDVANDFKGALGTAVGGDLIIDPTDNYFQTKRKTGWIVDGTNKILKITAGVATNSADDADIDVIIIGIAT